MCTAFRTHKICKINLLSFIQASNSAVTWDQRCSKLILNLYPFQNIKSSLLCTAVFYSASLLLQKLSGKIICLQCKILFGHPGAPPGSQDFFHPSHLSDPHFLLQVPKPQTQKNRKSWLWSAHWKLLLRYQVKEEMVKH